MRFLLSALGSAGDVHPFIAIGEALRARGHDVSILASPPFESRVRAAGLDFVALGTQEDYERVLQRAELWHPRRGARLVVDELVDHLSEAYATLEAATTPDTVLVGSSLSWAVRLMQETHGFRAATVHLSPTLFLSASDPPVLPGVGDLSWLPRAVRRALFAFGDRVVLDRLVAPRLDRLRASLDLAPVRSVWRRWMHSPELVVGAWPEWFAPPQSDWPSNTELGGFALFDEGALDLDAPTRAFLDAGPPPIAITPGSAMAHGSDFIARALDATRRLGRRAIVVTPFDAQLPSPRSTTTHHTPYAPYRALLPRVAAMVHHGGIGTSARCLAAGVPQLVVPFAHDQFDNAARLVRLGVATTIDAKARGATWDRALRVLETSPMRASVRSIAARMAAEPAGATRIAMRLEAFAR